MADTQPIQLTAPLDPLINQRVGEYVIEATIASGGMGIVYRAVHPLIGRRVAIKVVRPEMVSDTEQADRFLKEAQALSAIKHRGIIEIIGFGNLPDGRQYMVMEFLDGEPLEALMSREGAMPAGRALPLVDEILSALSAAHKAGVVHRDLKPSNVFISLQTSGDRTVKVLDFGLAKHAPVVFDGAAGPIGARSSLMAGTPEYIAPEQAKGLVATGQTDLYCVGVMLFEMLTGELPFTAPEVVELMRKHVSQPPPKLADRVSGMPESLDALVAMLLEKEPGKRPSSADVARQTVQRILRELREQSTHQARNPLLNKPPPPSPSAKASQVAMSTAKLPERIAPDSAPPRPVDRRPALLLFLLLFFTGGVGLALWLHGLNRPPASPPPHRVPPAVAAAPVPPAVVASVVQPPPAPAPPTDPLAVAAPEAPASDEDLAALTRRKQQQQKHKQVVHDDDVCTVDADRRRDLVKTSEEMESAFRAQAALDQVSGLDTNEAIAPLLKVREEIRSLDDGVTCDGVKRRLDGWQTGHWAGQHVKLAP